MNEPLEQENCTYGDDTYGKGTHPSHFLLTAVRVRWGLNSAALLAISTPLRLLHSTCDNMTGMSVDIVDQYCRGLVEPASRPSWRFVVDRVPSSPSWLPRHPLSQARE